MSRRRCGITPLPCKSWLQRRTANDAEAMTAVDDLKTYGKFAQAHVDGLKSLTASFETLYNSMPDAQKKVADEVFQNRHRPEGGAAHS